MVTNTVVDMEVEKVADELDNYPRTDYGIIKVSTNKNQQYPTWHGANAGEAINKLRTFHQKMAKANPRK